MAVYTGNPRFSATLLPRGVAELLTPVAAPEPEIELLLDSLFPGFPILYSAPQGEISLDHLFLSEFSARSQFDQLIELVRNGAELPDRLACLSGFGLDFHGFKGRSWAAVAGNLHLAVHLAPRRSLARFGPAFTALATVSVVDALDEVPGLEGRSSIKWVNDILLDGAKIAGSLEFTQSQEDAVSCAILGIGLNVEVAPNVPRSPSVPRVGSVRGVLPEAEDPPRLQAGILAGLLRALENNYSSLLSDGPEPLLQRYRNRSAVVGEKVTIVSDASDQDTQVLARGRVVGLGDNLELLLDSQSEPVTGGRIILGEVENGIKSEAPEAACGAGAGTYSEGSPP